jgi:hypothetical protein
MKCFRIFKEKSKPNRSKTPPNRNSESTKPGSISADSAPSPRTVLEMYKLKEKNLRVFSFSEMRNATHDFNKLLKIGEGGFGKVYKGSIKIDNGEAAPSSLVVAIKKLNKHG